MTAETPVCQSCGHFVLQLLDDSENMFKHIEAAHSKHEQKLFDDERFETLWKVFDAMIRDEQLESVSCIVDRLDECVEESLDSLLIKISELYRPGSPILHQKLEARMRIIFSSRNYPRSFEDHLHAFPRLGLEPDLGKEIVGDIEKYVDCRLEELACAKRKKPKLDKLRSNVKKKLIDDSNGAYLWVSFAISLLNQENCPELEDAVNRFPRGLDVVYKRMLLSVQSDKREAVISIIR